MQPAPLIAAQLYTVRESLRDADSFLIALERLRSIGFGAVELAGIEKITASTLARLLAATEMLPCSLHVYWDRLHNATESVIETCEAVGCTTVVVVAMPPEYRNLAGYQRFATELLEIAVPLHRHGIDVAYHHHTFEFERHGSDTGLELLLQATRSGQITAQLDTYWAQSSGASPAAWIRKLGGRLHSVHLKDMTVEHGEPTMAELGSGNLDWPDIIQAALDVDVKCLIVEQDTSRRDPYESLAMSLEFLTNALHDARSPVSGVRTDGLTPEPRPRRPSPRSHPSTRTGQ